MTKLWRKASIAAILLGMTPAQASDPAPQPKRTIHAPQADVAPGVVLSVELADNEDVQWQWSHGPDGQSHITGYQILKSQPDK